MDQREATRKARQHPAVLKAQERLYAYLRKRGITRPEDPRCVNRVEVTEQQAELSHAHSKMFSLVRKMLAEGTTEAVLAEIGDRGTPP
ncbi:MAG: hypothetical protein WD795_00635 [Woeseia sp.]